MKPTSVAKDNLEEATGTVDKSVWSARKKIAFRLFFCYFVLYDLPFPFGWIPGTSTLADIYISIWHSIVLFVGAHFPFRKVAITVFTNGSGDTTYDYFLVLCYAIVSILATCIWTLSDRYRTDYDALHRWFRVWLRLLLAATMMLFGSVKIFPVQFPYPTFSRLLELYGDSSPLGLLSTFMGYSRSYSVFTGLVEMVGGILLVFPPLALVGALISAAAMTHVLVINLSYDVPVKLYALHVLVMCLIVLAPDLTHLANVLILNRAVRPRCLYSPCASNRANQTLIFAQLIFGVFFAVNSLYQARRVDGHDVPKPPFYGAWDVDDFSPEPPIGTQENESDIWRRIIFDTGNIVTVQLTSGKLVSYQKALSDNGTIISLVKIDDQSSAATISVEPILSDQAVLKLRMGDRNFRVRMHRASLPFLLQRRPFHWIEEAPFNR